MEKFLNYIANGKGWGLKVFVLFSVLICMLSGFLIERDLWSGISKDETVASFVSQIPPMEIKNGRIVNPDNVLIQIPFVPGLSDGLTVNTTSDVPVSLNFDNGFYLTKDTIYVKMLSVGGSEIYSAPLDDLPNIRIDKAFIYECMHHVIIWVAIIVSVVLFVAIWIGYLGLFLILRVLGWIFKRPVSVAFCSRVVTVSWMSLFCIHMVLMAFGYTLILEYAFLLALVLSVGLMVKVTGNVEALEHTMPAEPVEMPIVKAEVVKASAKKQPVVKEKMEKTTSKTASQKRKVAVSKDVKTKTPKKKTTSK